MTKKKRKKKRLPVPPLRIRDHFVYYLFGLLLLIFVAEPILLVFIKRDIFLMDRSVLAVQSDWTIMLPFIPHFIISLFFIYVLYSLYINKFRFINKIKFNKKLIKKLVLYTSIILIDISISVLFMFHRTELTLDGVFCYGIFNQEVSKEEFSNLQEVQVGIMKRFSNGVSFNIKIEFVDPGGNSKFFDGSEFRNLSSIKEIVDSLTKKGIPKVVKDLDQIENLKTYRNYTEDDWLIVQALFDLQE